MGLVVVGMFLVGDTARRLDLAWTLVVQWWPWALLGLAAVNLVRSFLRLESLLAPGLLAAVAVVVIAMRQGVAGLVVIDYLVPAVLVVIGAALLLSISSRGGLSWTRVLMTGTVDAPAAVTGVLRPRVILGELRANLAVVEPGDRTVTMNVTAIFGHVRIEVPRDWKVELHAEGSLLTSVRDRRPNPAHAVATLRLHVLGIGGVVTIKRVD
jgi:hypothetical protein